MQYIIVFLPGKLLHPILYSHSIILSDFDGTCMQNFIMFSALRYELSEMFCLISNLFSYQLKLTWLSKSCQKIILYQALTVMNHWVCESSKLWVCENHLFVTTETTSFAAFCISHKFNFSRILSEMAFRRMHQWQKNFQTHLSKSQSCITKNPLTFRSQPSSWETLL